VRAARDAQDHEAFTAALEQAGAEFAIARDNWFDGFVNGLNRLPRPLLALGTLGLFGYAMAEPAGFGLRMQGLALVPEPLWWLLGAIVSFYFGARELHYRRGGTTPAPARPAGAGDPAPARAAIPAAAPAPAGAAADPDANAALEEWRRLARS